jgi:hypothetical protein
MQPHARPQHKQLVRIAAILITGSCAAVIAILLDWAPFSIGGASDNPIAVSLSATSVLPPAKEAVAESASKPTDTPREPTCAELGGVAPMEPETFGGPRRAVGCDMFNNLAAATPATNQSNVEAFLAWHLQARNLIQDSYQAGIWEIGER